MPAALIEIVPIGNYSDGESSKWSNAPSTWRPLTGNELDGYRTSLGNKWKSERKESQSGRVYAVESLPQGYRLFGHNRENDPKHMDKYLYGHPSGYAFRSMPEFYPHFAALMNGSTQGCQCKGCVKPSSSRASIGGSSGRASIGKAHAVVVSPAVGSSKRPSGSHNSSLPQGPLPPPSFILPKEDLSEPVDEEGTPDIWRLLAQRLKTEGSLQLNIEEPDSIDWQIEHKVLPGHIINMQSQPRWMPRKGELVLYMRKLKESQSVIFDKKERAFRIWDSTSESWEKGSPAWEAGIITETSAPEEPANINDLVMEKGKEFHVTYSGFRVEPVPKIGADEKPWSKRLTYVPLHQLRPFTFWKEYLTGVEGEDHNIHPTIKHALTAAPSIAPLYKFHYKGVYPNATVFCKGVYIGPELVLQGDIVRLTPTSGSTVTDVMKVTAIKIKLLDMDDPYDPNPPLWMTCQHISGMGYTTDASKAYGTGKVPILKKNLPAGLDGYGSWYPMHAPDKRLELPFHRILGRCYEDEAMMLWLPSSINSSQAPTAFQAINATGKRKPEVDLSVGLEGMKKARLYGKAHDPRILREEGKSWFFGDNRVNQLDLREIKGVDVGANAQFGGIDAGNDPRQAKHLAAMKQAQKARERGVVASKAVSGMTEQFANSALVASGMNVLVEGQEEEEEEQEGEGMEEDEESDGAEFIAGSQRGMMGSQRGMMGTGNGYSRGDAVFID